MSPDDIKQITNLVALQLQQAAAEQATERESVYRMVLGLVETIKKLNDQVQKAMSNKGPVFNEAAAGALVEGTRGLVARSIEPLSARIDALEQQQNGGH
jgi:hypothetical protein